MKNKTWICLILGLFLACLGLSICLYLPAEPAAQVQVWSDGKMIAQLDLDKDDQITVESAWGTNIVTVHNGTVGVTEADCPDGYCMARGFCNGGAQIVCLPNRLVIRFVGKSKIDGVVG